jgi:hypothetical protein
MRAQLQSKVRADELSIEEVASVTPSPPSSRTKVSIQLESIWLLSLAFVTPMALFLKLPPIIVS